MNFNYNDINYDIDESLSFKNFVNHYVEIPNNAVIYASSFYHESPQIEYFPETMENVIFIKCNLDNIKIPAGVTLIDCKNELFQVQEDGNDWRLGENLQPIEIKQ
jgi:hypothetical protein